MYHLQHTFLQNTSGMLYRPIITLQPVSRKTELHAALNASASGEDKVLPFRQAVAGELNERGEAR